MTQLNEEEQAVYGEEVAKILLLKKRRNGRYKTAWGDKTPIGLFRTICRVIDTNRKITWRE